MSGSDDPNKFSNTTTHPNISASSCHLCRYIHSCPSSPITPLAHTCNHMSYHISMVVKATLSQYCTNLLLPTQMPPMLCADSGTTNHMLPDKYAFISYHLAPGKGFTKISYWTWESTYPKVHFMILKFWRTVIFVKFSIPLSACFCTFLI